MVLKDKCEKVKLTEEYIDYLCGRESGFLKRPPNRTQKVKQLMNLSISK